MKAGNAIWVVAVAAAVAVGVGCGDGGPQERTLTFLTPEVSPVPTRPATGEGPEPSGKIAFVGSHMREDGSDLRRLTDHPVKESYPSWAP